MDGGKIEKNSIVIKIGNGREYTMAKEYLIPLADRMEVQVDVEILDNSLQPEIDDDLPYFDLFNL